MKDKIDKCSLELTINKEDIYNKPKKSNAFNGLFSNTLVRNWQVKYQNYLKYLKDISVE